MNSNISQDLKEKEEKLQSLLKKFTSLLVAFSGGVDSSFLLYKAGEILGRKNVFAVTVKSPAFPKNELIEAKNFCNLYKIKHNILPINILKIINANKNTELRCYYCKLNLFQKIKKLALNLGFAQVVEGSNKDDLSDYRPGSRALKELNIFSPLQEAGLTKTEIKLLAQQAGLVNWQKAQAACLISRFPYFKPLKIAALKQVERAEDFLKNLGFALCRVRWFGQKAVIEVAKEKIEELLTSKALIEQKLKKLGFSQIEFDLAGYRQGRMNNFIL